MTRRKRGTKSDKGKKARGAINNNAQRTQHTILEEIRSCSSPCHLYHVPKSPAFNHNLSLGFFFEYPTKDSCKLSVLLLKMSGHHLSVNDSAARAKAKKLIEFISEKNFHVDDKDWEEIGASNPRLRTRLQSTFSRLRDIAGHSVKT